MLSDFLKRVLLRSAALVSDVAEPRRRLFVCRREMLLCKLLWAGGGSLDTARYYSEMCHECRRGGYVYMKPNRWLCTTCAICRGDPPPSSDIRCNNCQRNEGAHQKKKQSPQTAIASHIGGAENKATGTKGKYQILHNNGRRRARTCNKSVTLSPFRQIKAGDTANAACRREAPAPFRLFPGCFSYTI